MHDSLKKISESIDAIRSENALVQDVLLRERASAHLDILLVQIAEELRRAHRGEGSAQAVAAMLERKI